MKGPPQIKEYEVKIVILTEAELLFKSRMGTLYSASVLNDERTELNRCIVDSDDNKINEEASIY